MRICTLRRRKQPFCDLTHRLRSFAYLILAVLALAAVKPVCAQDYSLQTGSPTFTTQLPVEMGFLNVANGNLHLSEPLAAFPQRGRLEFAASLEYDSRIWQIVNVGSSITWQPTNVPNSQGGWRFSTPADPGKVNSSSYLDTCTDGPPYAMINDDFVWTEPNGTIHFFPISTTSSGTTCPRDNPNGSARATDSTGLLMVVTNYTDAAVYGPDGTQLYPIVKDPNGNFFSQDANGNGIDTLGRTPVVKTVNGNTTTYAVLKSDGSRANYTVTTGTINVTTSFGVSGVTEFSGTLTVIQSITLPDTTQYSFGYDSYGELNSVTLPTGGTVSYGYNNFKDALGGTNRWVTSWTSAGGPWTYTPLVTGSCTSQSPSCAQQVTVAKPSGDNIVYTFILDNGAWTGSAKFYTGAVSDANLVETIANTWNFSNPCQTPGCTGNQNVQISAETVTLPVPGASFNRTTKWTFDSPNDMNVAKVQQWNYYTGALPANPTTETDISYWTLGNIIDRPKGTTICPGSQPGCTISTGALSSTNYTYDDSGYLVDTTPARGIVNHDDANFCKACPVARGNLTTIQRWVGGSSFLTSTAMFDTTGQTTQITDPNNNVTKFGFADNFFTDNGANPAQTFTPAVPTNAYLTSVTVPILGTASNYGYYFSTGKGASSVDQNGADSYTHYDSLDRLATVYLPPAANGQPGWMLAQYPNSTEVDTYTSITSAGASASCTSCRHQQVIADTFGRQVSETLVNDPDGATTVATSYDSSGRVQSTTNPYRSTSDPTYGLETLTYDGLDRITVRTHSDGSMSKDFYGADVGAAGGLSSQQCPASTCGLGYPHLTVDPAGKARQTWTDAFGNIIEVDEPNGPSAPLSGTLTINGNLQSILINGHPATPGSGSVTISGLEQSFQQCYYGTCHLTIWDTGSVSITVNGSTKSVSYGRTDTTYTIASALAAAFNGDSTSPVNASSSGNNITLTAKAAGAGTNYSLSATSATNKSYDFAGPSFFATPSGATLNGGQDSFAGNPVYDAGTVSMTVGGYSATANYGNGQGLDSTSAAVAGDLVAKIQAQLPTSNPPFSISVPSGGTAISINWNTAGVKVTAITTSTTSQTGNFSTPSFASCPVTANPQSCTMTLSGTLGAQPYVTYYTYDLLNNLTQVTQGSQTRSYVYDALSRVTSTTTPEDGTTSTYYTTAAGALCTGNALLICRSTDARGITTTNSFDQLNRATSVTYSDGTTPSVQYFLPCSIFMTKLRTTD